MSATIQRGVTSFDTLTLQNERADLYSLRSASEPSACHASPAAMALHRATHCAPADNQSAEHLATSTRCCHLTEPSSRRRTAHSVPVVGSSGARAGQHLGITPRFIYATLYDSKTRINTVYVFYCACHCVQSHSILHIPEFCNLLA